MLVRRRSHDGDYFNIVESTKLKSNNTYFFHHLNYLV